MTNAFYFGSAEKQLFGIYHEPTLGRDRPCGVVLCNPFGREYIRSHRSYQKLAVQLSKAGFHVIRFDYYGSGDSAGDSDAATLAQWRDDILAATVEIKDCAGIEDLSLVGLRLGASLAIGAAAQRTNTGISNLVLWEPVIGGKNYVAELQRDHQDWYNGLLPKPPRRHAGGGIDDEVLGHPLTERLWGEIAGIDLLALEPPQVSRALLVGADDDNAMAMLNRHLQARGIMSELQKVPAPKVWLKQGGLDMALIPNATLQCITSWIDKVNA